MYKVLEIIEKSQKVNILTEVKQALADNLIDSEVKTNEGIKELWVDTKDQARAQRIYSKVISKKVRV